jgi:long-chain fatty acid transport protein
MVRKFLVCSIITASLVSFVIDRAMADQLHQEDGILPNHSAEYVRTQSRNASIDADAVFYNPAGTAFMEKQGLYIMLSLQGLYDKKDSSFQLQAGAQTKVGPLGSLFPWSPSTHLGQPLFYTTNNKYLVPKRYPGEVITPDPDLDIVYKGKNWAVFLYEAITQSAGLSGLEYKNGVPDLDRAILILNESVVHQAGLGYIPPFTTLIRKNNVKRDELYISGTIGGSYVFFNWLSAAIAYRFIYGSTKQVISQIPWVVHYANDGCVDPALFNAPVYISTSTYGSGHGIILGLDVKPLENLNIGLRGEYYSSMILTKKTNKFLANPIFVQSGQLNLFADGIAPMIINSKIFEGTLVGIHSIDFGIMDPRYLKLIGKKVKTTYPPSVHIGVAYNILKDFKETTSANITFPRARDLDGREKYYKPVGFRIGQSIEYTLFDMIIVSAGYSYNDFGIRNSHRTETDELLNSQTIGAGCTIKAPEWMDVTVSGFYSIFRPQKVTTIDAIRSYVLTGVAEGVNMWVKKFYEHQWGIALGITGRYFGEGAPFGSLVK